MNDYACSGADPYRIATQVLKAADPKLGAMIDQVGLCTLDQIQQTGDLLDSLARSIIYQQLSTKAATAIHQRFLQLYTNGLTTEAILNTPDQTLREVGTF